MLSKTLEITNEALRIIGGVLAIGVVLCCMVLGALVAGLAVGLGVWK